MSRKVEIAAYLSLMAGVFAACGSGAGHEKDTPVGFAGSPTSISNDLDLTPTFALPTEDTTKPAESEFVEEGKLAPNATLVKVSGEQTTIDELRGDKPMLILTLGHNSIGNDPKYLLESIISFKDRFGDQIVVAAVYEFTDVDPRITDVPVFTGISEIGDEPNTKFVDVGDFFKKYTHNQVYFFDHNGVVAAIRNYYDPDRDDKFAESLIRKAQGSVRKSELTDEQRASLGIYSIDARDSAVNIAYVNSSGELVTLETMLGKTHVLIVAKPQNALDAVSYVESELLQSLEASNSYAEILIASQDPKDLPNKNLPRVTYGLWHWSNDWPVYDPSFGHAIFYGVVDKNGKMAAHDYLVIGNQYNDKVSLMVEQVAAE